MNLIKKVRQGYKVSRKCSSKWKHSLARFVIVFGVGSLTGIYPPAWGSNERIPTTCEQDWDFHMAYRHQTVPLANAWLQRERAEQGDAQAQYFMGVSVQLPASERIAWLKKAIAGGSKGASAYFSFYIDDRWKGDAAKSESAPKTSGEGNSLSPEVHTELLQPVVEAAEAGEPQAATWMLKMARRDIKPCRGFHGDACPPTHLLVRTDDVVKWAEIAARGGNVGAAEYLCRRFEYDARERTKSPDDDARAFQWCQIAAPNACALFAQGALSTLYRDGRGTLRNLELSQYWRSRSGRTSKDQTFGTSVMRSISSH